MWFSLVFLAGIVLGSLVSLLPGSGWIRSFRSSFFALFPCTPSCVLFLLVFTLYLFSFIPFSSSFFGSFPRRCPLSILRPKFDAFHIAFYNDREYDLLITGNWSSHLTIAIPTPTCASKVGKVDTGDGDLPVSGLILVRASDNKTFTTETSCACAAS